MAETALERFKTEQALKKERERVEAKEGEVKNLDQFQQSFLEALENISEPKKPVRYLKPFNIFQSEDKSLARFITQGSPTLQIFLNNE